MRKLQEDGRGLNGAERKHTIAAKIKETENTPVIPSVAKDLKE
jgi:hypothetical protein